MQAVVPDDKWIPSISLRIYSTNHKQRYKNINITYKYLFTYFQGADRPSASKRSWICSSSLYFSTSCSSVVRWDGDSSGFITVHAQAHKNLKINQKARREQHHKTKAHGTHTQQYTCALVHKHTRTHRHSGKLTLARLNFLDDRELVIDEHRRAEVSLESSRLMEESRKQNYFFAVSMTSCL